MDGGFQAGGCGVGAMDSFCMIRRRKTRENLGLSQAMSKSNHLTQSLRLCAFA
jgi:hypothetical protein